MLATLMLALPAAGGEVTPAPDVVLLKNGRTQKGRVVHEDDLEVVLLVKTRGRRIAREDIESVRSIRAELPRALDQISGLRSGDLAAHHALAQSLEERNLPNEARLVYRMVLGFRPADDLANEKLGHRRRGGHWTLPHAGRHYRLEERQKQLANWDGAWELASTHYRVRSNLPLQDAIRTTLDLERTYRGFYRIFGPDLDLWEITEPMQAHVHADAASFPESFGSGRSYFSRSDGRVVVNASRGPVLGTMVHEATHGLLFFSSVDRRSARRSWPGWLDEGLAEYMETCRTGPAGAIAFLPGQPSDRHFHTHAEARKPYKLSRVLNFQGNDFGGTSRTDLKYAQSYTLVDFCLHGADERHRAGFFEFLRSVYAGKTSSTHFKKALGAREKEIEDGWHAHAASAGR